MAGPINTKKVLFLTATRADFGKLKSLISVTQQNPDISTEIFVTGMHMLRQYGYTVNEVEETFKNIFIYKFMNQRTSDSMDMILSKTINGLSTYVSQRTPDLIVVHGDRVETLAGAITGSLNNILVAHIEGGELSGTIDESIRHCVTKLSHIHMTSNLSSYNRLKQLGEDPNSIYIIGSPDLDVMLGENIPPIEQVKSRYSIDFDKFAIFMYHPVTTELEILEKNIDTVIDSLLEDKHNYVIVYPNNDSGSHIILRAIRRLHNNSRFCIFPSIRFEYFLSMIKNCEFMIGNSSAGVREAPFYGVPTINIGTRQRSRAKASSIFNVTESQIEIKRAIFNVQGRKFTATQEFGNGNSDQLFADIISNHKLWNIPLQKRFFES